MNKKYFRSFTIVLSTLVILYITRYLYVKYDQRTLIYIIGIMTADINLLRIPFSKKMAYLFDCFIKYRYVIALIVFILCVGCKVNGSSVSFYDTMFTDKIDDTETGVLIGHGRDIRGDEYNVQLPYYFSQYYNDFEKISYQMSLSGQDMILGYNAPVKDLTIIGKPFVWGYVLLGNEYGLSWYWCMKTILFLLVSFEVCNLLTSKNGISLLGAFLIVFSPSMQWWFSPHMYDVFFWASTLLAIGYHYFTVKDKKMKWALTILAPCAIIGFVLGLFPSCQLPLGLIAITLLIALLVRDKEKITFVKKDWLRIAIDVAIVLIVLGSFLLSSKENITLLYSTVYPGKRISTGGEFGLSDLFTDLTNIFIPFKQSIILNNSEVSTFNHLGILFMFYFPFLYYRMRKHSDKERIIGMVFAIILLIEIWFMVVGFPEWLAKITLFSYINRMKIVYGFTATLFTVWNTYILMHKKEYVQPLAAILCLIAFASLYLYVTPETTFEYFRTYSLERNVYIEILMFTMIGAFIFLRYQEISSTGLLSFAVISSCTVNPIAIGAPAIYNHEISTVTNRLIENENGYWLCTDSGYDQNFFLANGAKVINAVNFYPDFKKWELIDPTGEHEDYYNRYAHMKITISDITEPVFNLAAPDSLELTLPVSYLETWNIKYITSRTDYSSLFEQNNIKFTVEYHSEKDMTYVYSIQDESLGRLE